MQEYTVWGRRWDQVVLGAAYVFMGLVFGGVLLLYCFTSKPPVSPLGYIFAVLVLVLGCGFGIWRMRRFYRPFVALQAGPKGVSYLLRGGRVFLAWENIREITSQPRLVFFHLHTPVKLHPKGKPMDRGIFPLRYVKTKHGEIAATLAGMHRQALEATLCGPDLHILPAMVEILSRGDAALARRMWACVEDPDAYYIAHQQDYLQRGVGPEADHATLCWLALVDMLQGRWMWEMDWKATYDAAELGAVLQRLLAAKGLRANLSLAGNEPLGQVAAELADVGLALANVNLNSDSYPLAVVTREEMEALLRLQRQMGPCSCRVEEV